MTPAEDAGPLGASRPGRAFLAGMLAVLAAALLLVLAVHADYGVSWDEGVQSRYGELVLEYFRSGLQDTRSVEFEDLRFYGAWFELLCAAFYGPSEPDNYARRHLLTGLMMVLGLPAIMLFAWRIAGGPVAVFAGAALLAMPRFLGHAFHNSKDMPFATTYAWAMTAILLLLLAGRWTWTRTLACGAAIGMALGLRVGALLLFVNLAAGLAYMWIVRHPRLEPVREDRLRNLARLGVVAVVAWLLMVTFWPWAHENVLLNPLGAFQEQNAFSRQYVEFFEGRDVPSAELPWYYLPKYLLMTTPPGVLLLAGLGAGLTARRIVRRPRADEAVGGFLVLFWVAFPVAYVVARQPNVYNGIRHFLFVLPGLAILAAVGAAWLLDRVRGRGARLAAGAGLLALLLSSVPAMIELHPYQYTYFNQLAGGTGEASRRYDTDYWATSYREAMEWVNDHRRPDGETRVLVMANAHSFPCARAFQAEGIDLRRAWSGPVPGGFDYLIAMTKYHMDRTLPEAEILHRVERGGAVFAVVKAGPRLRGTPPAPSVPPEDRTRPGS